MLPWALCEGEDVAVETEASDANCGVLGFR